VIQGTYAVWAQAERRLRRRPRSAGERHEPYGAPLGLSNGPAGAAQSGSGTTTRNWPFASVTVCPRSQGGVRIGPVQSEPEQRGS
jgi:hypothetical protein